MLYDIDNIDNLQTHASAFSSHPGFSLVGAYDLEDSRRKLFSLKYSARAFDDLVAGLIYAKPDIVVVSTPTSTHLDIVRSILATIRPSCILCEKPMSYSSSKCSEIVNLCRNQNVKLFVNYIRRSENNVKQLASSIKLLRESQVPFKGVIWYSKGIYNNASHLIDLTAHFFGNQISVSDSTF